MKDKNVEKFLEELKREANKLTKAYPQLDPFKTLSMIHEVYHTKRRNYIYERYIDLQIEKIMQIVNDDKTEWRPFASILMQTLQSAAIMYYKIGKAGKAFQISMQSEDIFEKMNKSVKLDSKMENN